MLIETSWDPTNNFYILTAEGKITRGAGDEQLRAAIVNALTVKPRGIVMDLERVSTIDSSGLGEFYGSYTTVVLREVMFAAVKLPDKIRELLIVMQLDSVIPVFGSVAEAIDALYGLSFSEYIQLSLQWTIAAREGRMATTTNE